MRLSSFIEKIVEVTPGMIAVYDLRSGRYLYVNDAVTKILGYQKAEILEGGLPFVLSLIHPDDRERIQEENNRALEFADDASVSENDRSPIIAFEYRVKHKDGSWRWIRTDGTVFARDEKGSVEQIINVSVDITRQKEAEMQAAEALKASEERFRTLIQQGNDAIQLLSAEGKILWTSDSIRRVLGYAPEEIEGHGREPYVHPEDMQMFSDAIAYLLEKPGNQVHLEYRVKHKDGTWAWLETIGVNHLENPAIRALVGNFRNITRRKETEERQKLLERQKEEFIAICSHELKTPVTSIRAYTHVLERRASASGDEQAMQIVSKIDAQIDELTGLVGDLTDATEIGGARIQFRKDMFDLNELVSEIVENIQRANGKHRFLQKLASSQAVYGDRRRIGQVLANILTNAVTYSPADGTIIIATAVEQDAVVVSVEDFGIGIAKEDQEKIFNRFYRVSGSKQETYPGLGLGLYISAEIVRGHNGNIWVESEEGEGATFFFSLPLQK